MRIALGWSVREVCAVGQRRPVPGRGLGCRPGPVAVPRTVSWGGALTRAGAQYRHHGADSGSCRRALPTRCARGWVKPSWRRTQADSVGSWVAQDSSSSQRGERGAYGQGNEIPPACSRHGSDWRLTGHERPEVEH